MTRKNTEYSWQSKCGATYLYGMSGFFPPLIVGLIGWQVDKYTFPPAGTTGRLPTPSHKLNKTFKFRDYAPKVFKKLRELYGIDEVTKHVL